MIFFFFKILLIQREKLYLFFIELNVHKKYEREIKKKKEKDL